MATIDQVYELLKFRATKAGFNGTISPNEFNLVWPRAERRHFNNLYKQYEATQEVGESLLPFKTDPINITVDSQGKYIKPINILHIDSVRVPFQGSQRQVIRITDDRLGNKLSSQYDAPNAEFPIYVDYSGYLQFYPTNIGSAILVYLAKLEDSKWAYTLVNGRPVYDEANSIQPKWSDDDIDEISYMALSDISINMRDQLVEQFAERKIQTNL